MIDPRPERKAHRLPPEVYAFTSHEVCRGWRAATEGGPYRLAMMLGIALSFITSPLLAQRDLKEIPPANPEMERQSFVLPEGFEVNLFAADPQIAKPIQMNFDPQGRLWLATSKVYPHIKPGQTANDKILVLEDSDGDGESDRTTVFADGLMIPTGVAPGDGGAYVANSTQLLHLEDTDGDGRADRERIVLSGFGTEDTHHILHTLRWGPDGCLYFNQSIYIHSHIETPYGVRRLNGGGIWRFRPQTMELEVFARGWINPWGHQFDKFGTSFVTDGAGGQGINYAVPGGAYATAVGAERILPGLNPGSPKYCGLEIVSGSALPEDWQGDLITHDFRGHRVCRFKLERDGSGFTSRQMPDLIRSSHVAFRPVDVAMGPDGAIYIADWYNPIIQHGEVDFRDPRRDHTHGRIWRITYKEKPTLPKQDLTKLKTIELLELLKSDEPWQRRQAKRVLAERDAEEVAQAAKTWWVVGTDPQPPRHQLERAWLLHAIGRADAQVCRDLLDMTDGRIRAAACRLAGEWVDRDPQILAALAEAAVDDDPLVRLEAVQALAKDRRHVETVTHALRALDQPVDQWLDYALWQTCRDLAPVWLPALKAGEFDFGGDARKMAFALRAVRDPAAVTALTRLIRADKLPAAQAAEALKVVAELGRPDDLAFVFGTVLDANDSPAQQADLLGRLAEATRRRKARPSDDLGRVVTLFDHDDERVRRAAFALAGVWQVEAARKVLEAAATNTDAKPADRRAAFTALQSLGGVKSREFFASLATSKASEKRWPVRADAVIAWAEFAPADAAREAVKLLQDVPTDAAVEPLFAAFIGRKNGPAALTAALGSQKLPEDIGRLGLRAVESSGQTLPELTAALTESAGITAGPRVLSPEEMQKTVAEVAATGDARRGEAVYRRKSLACTGCHAIGGAGGQVGPDLISLGASAPVDYIVDSLLQPNKAVKENYHSLVVATDDGRVLTGVKVRQSDTELILRDAEDRLLTMPLDTIVGQKVGQSLMPAGLTEKLPRRELIDLVRFLSELGKVDGLAPDKTETARRWRVMQPTDEAKHRLRRTSYEMAATDDPAFTWEPAYSRVDGVLPLEDVPALTALRGPRADEPEVAFARTEIEVTRPGALRLQLNDPAGLQAWIGRTPITLDEEIQLELPSGRHRLTFAIRPAERNAGLHLRLQPGRESEAAARFVLGK